MQPERVNFNFLARCNMSCRYCYCPFDAQEADLDLWKQIIDKVRSWQCTSITFGGGDPFLYDDFLSLLTYTKQCFDQPIFIQVDTNGLGVNETHYSTIANNVDLLGLPLDGSNARIHGLMRSSPQHFSVVLSLIKGLNQLVSMKINTVVSKLNVADLENMVNLLSQFSIDFWSLYEFWSIGSNATKHDRLFTLDHDEFIEKAEHLKKICEFAKVEIGSISARSRAYFFVSQTGRAYAVNSQDDHQYVELGSVFDDMVLKKWELHADADQVRNRIRKRMNQS